MYFSSFSKIGEKSNFDIYVRSLHGIVAEDCLSIMKFRKSVKVFISGTRA